MTLSKVAIVASAQTELRPAWSNAQHIDLISAVVSSVFKGTGLSLDDVDFVIDSGSDVLDGRSISNCGFLGAMGAHHKEESRVEEDGLWAALYGVSKIRASGSGVGLIIAYSKPSESKVSLFYDSQCEPFYQRPVGFGHLAASGIQAQRYLARKGASASDLARLVSRRWSSAARYGGVLIGAVPGEKEVLASANVATPLKELMLARPMDGAVAILLASEDIARRTSRNPVWVTGLGAAMDRHSFAARAGDRLEACEAAVHMAFDKAGWDKAKIDVAEVSASTAVTELMVLEAAGVSEDGGTAVNLSGGALPADPIMATGLVRLAQAARQLSTPELFELGTPTKALAHGSGGVGMQSHCVFALEV
jgi:acetyl-CoA C-acetyltransferase